MEYKSLVDIALVILVGVILVVSLAVYFYDGD